MQSQSNFATVMKINLKQLRTWGAAGFLAPYGDQSPCFKKVQRFILGRDPEGITMHSQNKQFGGQFQTIQY